MASETIDQWRTQNAITTPTDDCLLPAKDAGATGAVKAVELRARHTTKNVARVATTANGTLATAFANGQVIDGVTLATGNRILVKDQNTGSENGLYAVNASGAPTRALDMTTAASAAGATAEVSEGTVNANTGWRCTSDAGSDVIGTDALTFAQTGDVVGASIATDNAFPRFDGTTGKIIQSGLTVEDNIGQVQVASNLTALGSVIIGEDTVGAKGLVVHESTYGGGEPIGLADQVFLTGQDVGGTTELFVQRGGAASSTPLTGPNAVANSHAARHLSGGADPLAAASATARGTIELATQAEADAGTDVLRAMTPDVLRGLAPLAPIVDTAGTASTISDAAVADGVHGRIFNYSPSTTPVVIAVTLATAVAGSVCLVYVGSSDTTLNFTAGAGMTVDAGATFNEASSVRGAWVLLVWISATYVAVGGERDMP